AFVHTTLDVAFDTLDRFGGDDGAHFGTGIHAIADLEGLDALGQAGNDFVSGITHQNSYGNSHATLASRTKARPDQGVNGLINVGIGHDDQVVFGATQCLYPFAKMRATLVDVFGDGGGAHKAEGGHIRVFDQGIDRDLVTMDNVEDAIGQACLLEQLSHEDWCRGIALAGFEDEAVASCDGHGEHPAGYHDREVEGG